MKKLIYLLFLPLFSLAQTGGLVIKGTVTGVPDSTTVFLMNRNDGKTLVSDVVKKGSFTLKANLADPELYVLGFAGAKEGIEMFLQNETVTVNADVNNMNAATISGAGLQPAFLAFKQQFVPYIEKLQTLSPLLGAETDPRRKDSLTKEYVAYKQKAVDATTVFVKTYPASPVSTLVILIMAPGFDGGVTELEARYAQLQPTAKRGIYAKMIEKGIADAKEAQARAAQPQPGQVGTQALDFTQTGSDGKPVTLSSFRGKYVLVDFWASWCRPCRMENPNVVNAYNQYKNKNFTVLGISLDQSKPNWLAAIQQDNLTWTHVSDLQYWSNAVAQLYHIQSIPANMLIDPNGKIVARDLRGEDLTRALNQLLK